MRPTCGEIRGRDDTLNTRVCMSFHQKFKLHPPRVRLHTFPPFSEANLLFVFWQKCGCRPLGPTNQEVFCLSEALAVPRWSRRLSNSTSSPLLYLLFAHVELSFGVSRIPVGHIHCVQIICAPKEWVEAPRPGKTAGAVFAECKFAVTAKTYLSHRASWRWLYPEGNANLTGLLTACWVPTVKRTLEFTTPMEVLPL